MKKLVIALLCILAALSLGCGGSTKPTTPPPTAKKTETTEAKTPAPKFDQVGYYANKNKDRSFCIYTNSTKKEELIAYARKQAYTEGRQTIVHFFNNEESTPSNTLLKTDEAGLWLQHPAFTDKYRKAMIGTYQKGMGGKEVWYEKDNATKEDTEYTAIK